ncbi:hypothetical protein [Polynucleobacter sp. CS-Odin-A6]|uniref:hypothetical protein n=1 Tax=Polynucleobacter sp. CS-Odin-A6 TaxID=2689106 RepID=UPI001C0BAF23|nr:hypothetical protein [Polynucleobacter sp. CS-Odin-A6]MBU3620974.1 hypothetical protein [Polynucleobacter sp. CS-Odin-A6]
MIYFALRGGLLILLGLLSLSKLTYAQSSKEDSVLCYKSAIREPLTFYGNPMDTFTLYDGSRWRVANGGPYEYIPVRYRNVIVCPTEQVLIIEKRALSVEKMRI